MSVQDQIDRIKANVAAAYTEAENMGAAMPEAETSDNLAGTLADMGAALSSTITQQDALIAQLRSALDGKAAGGGVQTATLTVTGDYPQAYYTSPDGVTYANEAGSYTCIVPSMVAISSVYDVTFSGSITQTGSVYGAKICNVTGDATVNISAGGAGA